MSERASTGSPAACSGLMYCGVPITMPSVVSGPLAASTVGVRERVGDLTRDAARVPHGQPRVLRQQLAERRPVDAAHHDVEDVLTPADLVDRHDAGMLELRDELRLAHEPRGERGDGGAIKVEHLDRHVAAQRGLPAAEDGREPAFAEQGPDGKFLSEGALEALLQDRN